MWNYIGNSIYSNSMLDETFVYCTIKYKKMLNKAIEQGHVVKAKLIKVKDAAGEGGHGQLFHQEILYVDYLMMVIYMIQLDLFTCISRR